MGILETIGRQAIEHPEYLAAWSHGFLAALALRRGRIEAILDKLIPVGSESGGEGKS
jgi:hypothetical protein